MEWYDFALYGVLAATLGELSRELAAGAYVAFACLVTCAVALRTPDTRGGLR